MSTPLFKKVLGTRLLLNRPSVKESVIELSAEAREEIDRDLIKQYTQLEVFAVGPDVEHIRVGERVLVPASILTHADMITIGTEMKFVVAERDVTLIW